MNAQNAKDYLHLVHALADGKTIQFNSCVAGWVDVPRILLHEPPDRYRVKPEPEEFWENRYPSGAVIRYERKEDADLGALSIRTACIHFREVIE